MSEYYKDANRYEDIINLSHHQSVKHAHMSLHDRAAQFAPFAALSGHEEAIEETARLTENRRILDEMEIQRINDRLCELAQHLSEKLPVSITYFKPDCRKCGGAYLTDTGTIKKIDSDRKVVVMDSGVEIAMEAINEVKIDYTG